MNTAIRLEVDFRGTCIIYFICLIFLEKEFILYEFTIGVVTNDHSLRFIRDVSFITDIRSRKSIITSYHHTIDLSLF